MGRVITAMFNLLLPSDKVALYREYMFRVVIVALGAFLLVVAIGIVFLFPSYIWLRINERAILEKRTDTLKSSVSEEALSTIEEASAALATLSTKKQVSYRELIEGLVAKRGSGIKLDGLEYAFEAGKLHLHISGVSRDRESLVAFSKAIGKDPAYMSVDVPISNFVKDRDIDFSLNIEGR